MTADFMFYAYLEEGVREAVRALRDAGINTECSCHHEGYIQCQSLDPTDELNTIYNVMHELDLHSYEVVLRRRVLSDAHHDSIEVRCEKWKTQEKHAKNGE